MKVLKITLLLILLATLIILAPKTESASNASCADYEFIFARGSGQKIGGVDYQAFKKAVKDTIKYERITFYELGRKASGYPAVATDFSVSLGAIISAGESYKFGESVERGVTDLISRVTSEAKKCEQKEFILAGYSQGAVVIDKALNYLDSNKILYAANFGDPKLYLPEGERGCKKVGISNYRVDVEDCRTTEGILGGMKPYQPASYYDKLGVWCNDKDIICGSSLNLWDPLAGHTSYHKKQKYSDLAKLVLKKINAKKHPAESEETHTEAYFADATKRDIAIVYDFREMLEIEHRKKRKSISDELKAQLVEAAKNGARIAVYNVYSLQTPIKFLELKIAFTSENLAEKIDKFNEENKDVFGYIGGGSNNNYWGMKDVILGADWRENSDRNVYLLTNYFGGSIDSYDGTTYEDVIDVAKEKYVKVSVLSTEGAEGNFRYQNIINATFGESIGRDFAKIIRSENAAKKLFSKTFEINQDSETTLVAINGMVYGLTNRKEITIVDLDENLENQITFTSFDKNGERKNTETVEYAPKEIISPSTGVI